MAIFIAFIIIPMVPVYFSFLIGQVVTLTKSLWSRFCAAIFNTLKQPIMDVTAQSCSRCAEVSMNNMVTVEQLTKSEHVIIGLMEVHQERRLQGEEDSKARQEQQFQALRQEFSATNKRVHAVECRTIETRRQCEEGRREGRHPTLFQKEHHQIVEAMKAKHAAVVAHLEKQLEAVAPAKKASYGESNLSQARPQSQVVSNRDKTTLTPSLSPHKTPEDQEVNDRTSRQPVADVQCESTQASKVSAPEELTNDATVDKLVSNYRDESGECKDTHEDADPAFEQPAESDISTSGNTTDQTGVASPASAEAQETSKSDTLTSPLQPFPQPDAQSAADRSEKELQQSTDYISRNAPTGTPSDGKDAPGVAPPKETDHSGQTTTQVMVTPDKAEQMCTDTFLPVNPCGETRASSRMGARRPLTKPPGRRQNKSRNPLCPPRSAIHRPKPSRRQVKTYSTTHEAVANANRLIACEHLEKPPKDVSVLVDAQKNVSSSTTEETGARSEAGSSRQFQDTKRMPGDNSHLGDLTSRMSELRTSESLDEPSAASEQDSAAVTGC
ncbi:hypothetical protein LTR70_008947 [Exophiala xenobiotica]|uniref:Uncharacterized protein n=1 Tax=Lithohypha guttulata TaxID=1690604 RepID=A0ABR0JZY5_9EURO|nr:hypothetical protein LTR24_008683 [Lithohypha guttulata]KAK5311184.1 hypothetical protein LTR70_008947 [Exophiala xenobiotica]